MNLFDFHKTIVQSSADSLKKLAVFNPLTIRKKGTRSKAIFALALVCVLWGTTWIASKEGVSHMPALQMAAIRQLIAGALYVGFFLYKGIPLPKGKEWTPVLVLSFLNFIMSNGLSTWGVKYISAGLGSIMGAIFPLWLVIIGLFISKEKIPQKALIGLLLGFVGVCIIFYEHLQDFFSFLIFVLELFCRLSPPGHGPLLLSTLNNKRQNLILISASACKCLYQEFHCTLLQA